MQSVSHSQRHPNPVQKTHIRTGLISCMVGPKASCVLHSMVLIWEQTLTYQSQQFIPVMF
uniref:Uncharacterized protein n=1 Tax=Lynx canadensis TaxID=61383 RepID=A0A667IUX1_LYNCA